MLQIVHIAKKTTRAQRVRAIADKFLKSQRDRINVINPGENLQRPLNPQRSA